MAIGVADSASGEVRRDVLYAQVTTGAVRHAAENGDVEEVRRGDDLLLRAPRAVLLHLFQAVSVVCIDH